MLQPEDAKIKPSQSDIHFLHRFFYDLAVSFCAKFIDAYANDVQE